MTTPIDLRSDTVTRPTNAMRVRRREVDLDDLETARVDLCGLCGTQNPFPIAHK